MTILSAPSWATTCEEVDGAILWRAVEPLLALAVDLTAYLCDEIVVRGDGHVVIARGEVEFFLRDDPITIEQARSLAPNFVSAIEGVARRASLPRAHARGQVADSGATRLT